MRTEAPAWTETIAWGIPGVKMGPALPDAAAFCVTPLIDLLLASAARAPDAVALRAWNAEIRYAELVERVRDVAAAIAARVPPGGAVACVLPRGPDGVAAVLGCMVSGRVCLSVNSDHPPDQISATIEDARPDLILGVKPTPGFGEIPILTLAEIARGPGRDWRPEHAWDPDAPLAVWFTSGSSGRPKGIVLSARALLTRAAQNIHGLGLVADDRIFTHGAHIVASNLAMIVAGLTVGANNLTGNLATEGANAILRLCEREAATILSCPPPMFRVLIGLARAPEAFRTVRVLRAAAAPLTGADLAAWRPKLPRGCAIQHTYASTEALIVAQWFAPPAEDLSGAPVGAGIPLPIHDYALIDPEGLPCAPGEAGELVIRGANLALGEWSGGKLVPGPMHPAPGMPGARIFRTGDLVRFRSDGVLCVAGRVDRQIKINGVRIEPAEIEAILKADPRVADAVAIVSAPESGGVLLGFVASDTADPAALTASLRGNLTRLLPAVARPARLIVLPALPRLSSGKIDPMTLARWPLD